MKFLIVGVFITVITQISSLPADNKIEQDGVSESDKKLEDEYAALASSADVRAKSKEVYKKISDPKDTELQSQIKALMAEYLVVTAIVDEEKEIDEPAFTNSIGGKAFGRDKHRPHHNYHNRDRNNNNNNNNNNNGNNQNRDNQPNQSPVIVNVQNYLPAQPAAAPVQQAPAPVPVVNYQPAYQQQQPQQQPAQVAQAPAQVPVAAVPAYIPNTPAPAPTYAPPSPFITAAPVQVIQQTQIPVITAPPPAPVQATQSPIIQAPVATQPPAVQAPAPAPAPVAPQVPVTQAPPVTRRPTVDPVYHLSQVNKILGNVATGNIVGIVDESLAIRTPQPVRTLVTNILKVVFCNPIDRIFNRCAPNQIAAANTRQ